MGNWTTNLNSHLVLYGIALLVWPSNEDNGDKDNSNLDNCYLITDVSVNTIIILWML